MIGLTIEERIRERAYLLWERAGCPEGRHDEFWQLACDQVEAEELREQDRIIADARGGADERP